MNRKIPDVEILKDDSGFDVHYTDKGYYKEPTPNDSEWWDIIAGETYCKMHDIVAMIVEQEDIEIRRALESLYKAYVHVQVTATTTVTELSKNKR